MADPIAVLQSRIEQLEAKLGLAANSPVEGQQGDSATANLVNTAQAISNATAGHEKLSEALPMATELNNYTDPNYVENLQQNQSQMQEVAAAEPAIQHHCQCMHRCKQAAAVLESEPIQHAPQMQEVVNNMQAAAAEVKVEAEQKRLNWSILNGELCTQRHKDLDGVVIDIKSNFKSKDTKNLRKPLRKFVGNCSLT